MTERAVIFDVDSESLTKMQKSVSRILLLSDPLLVTTILEESRNGKRRAALGTEDLACRMRLKLVRRIGGAGVGMIVSEPTQYSTVQLYCSDRTNQK
jgi:hypothetical protein